MTLYELTNDFMELWEMMDDPDVDEDAILDTLEGIDGEIEDKADGYAKVIAQANAQIDAYRNEELRLALRRRTLENNVKRMKDSLQRAMELTGKKKFKTALFSFSVQKNGGKAPLNIANADLVPEEFCKVTIEPDKTKIYDYLNAGNTCEWARLEERGESLRIR